MIFYRNRPPIYDISHRAIVIYDKKNQKTGLVPQVSFKGSPQDFCIVVPTPTTPRLHTVINDTFYEAQQLTGTIRRERGKGCFSGGDILIDSEEASEMVGEINVVSEELPGRPFAYTLPESPNALINWLDDHSYKYFVQDKDIIDYYAQKGWVFTVVEIDASALQDISGSDKYNVNHVLFTYSANSLTYPVHLSSIGTGDRTNIEIYILSGNKMTFNGARLEYANSIDDKELEEILQQYPAFGGLIGQQRYLTKLERTFSIMEMDTDMEIIAAPDNDEFRKVIYYGVSPIMDLVPLGIIAVFFLAVRLLKRYRDASGRASV
jgi:hypothetical protein